MEMEEIQNEECKFPRISNKEDGQYQYEVDDAGEVKKTDLDGIGKLYGWPSSRIVRVSRASGGKDRHSKVLTSKGLRDRRVRLSVNTAIQFYDLQDRLGCDQPSKVVEWLLKAAAPSIAELPPLEAFPDTLQLSDEKRSSVGTEPGFDSADVEMDDDPNYNQQQQQQPSCSNSETSKGSGLSLSRSDSRLKARERARERATEKEKEKEHKSSVVVHHQNMHPSSSFTELLTGGMSDHNNNNSSNASPNGSIHQNTPRQWSTNSLEYFTSGLLGPSSTRGIDNSTGFSGQIYLGNPLQPLIAVSSPMFSITGDHQPELQHFPFTRDNLVPAVTSSGGSNCNGQSSTSNEYNLNFSISSSASASSFSGFNRGTLQSNSSSSSSTLPHLQSSFMAMATVMEAVIQIRKEKEKTKFIENQVPFTAHLHPWQLKMEAASESQRKHACFSALQAYILLCLITYSALFIFENSYFLFLNGRNFFLFAASSPTSVGAQVSKLSKVVCVFFVCETPFVLKNLPSFSFYDSKSRVYWK